MNAKHVAGAGVAAWFGLWSAAAHAQSTGAAPTSWANEHTVSLYAGYRTGGAFTDSTTGSSVSIDGSGSLSASVDVPMDGARQIQVYFSYQDSQLRLPTGPSVPPSLGQGLPLKVMYLHLGGTNFFEGKLGEGGYVVGGLGVTQFSPGLNGYSTEWGPSMNIGIGYQYPLGRHMALRVEARAFVTIVNSNTALFCSGGCVFTLRGDVITQGLAQVGLSARF